MELKQELHTLCHLALLDRIAAIKKAIAEATEAGNNETKSTSGDKHETGRAMAQLEQEKNARQLKEALDLQMLFNRIVLQTSINKVVVGSLVETKNTYFYISIGLGRILEGNKICYAISPQSPMGKALLGKVKGNSVLVNGSEVCIQAII